MAKGAILVLASTLASGHGLLRRGYANVSAHPDAKCWPCSSDLNWYRRSRTSALLLPLGVV